MYGIFTARCKYSEFCTLRNVICTYTYVCSSKQFQGRWFGLGRAGLVAQGPALLIEPESVL